jgi:Neuraminidase (sialidase)
VIHTFAAHYAAIHGAIKVPKLGDSNSLERYPTGGLALSAAAIARALTLGKNGIITIEMIQESKASKKPITFTKATNQASGKQSTMNTAFSFAKWGDKTHEYVRMIKDDLRESSRQNIATQAYAFYKSKQQHSSSDGVSMDIDEPEVPRRRIRDLSDDEN